MGIYSANQLFSDDQAITVTAASTDYLDLGATGTPVGKTQLTRDIGKGQPVPLEVIVTEAFTAAGAATLTVDLEVDDNASFSSATTVKTITVGKADLTVGKNVFPDLFVPVGVNERYCRLNYTVTTGPMTAGKIYAGISMGRQTNDK